MAQRRGEEGAAGLFPSLGGVGGSGGALKLWTLCLEVGKNLLS